MNKFLVILVVFGVLLAIFFPLLVVQDWTGISFRDTGEIGDTIGGATAPIIGILSIVLLVYTLLEQIRFNKKQSEISTDEQFKSTFFNLLQVQRDIQEKIGGKFKFLGNFTYEEFSWKNGDVKIKKEGKEFLRINNNDDEVTGLEFFKAARYQLIEIFNSLDHDVFYNNYDSEEAFNAEMELQRNYISASDMPPEFKQKQDAEIISVLRPFQIAYINDKYGITQKIFDKYKTLSLPKQIGLAYAIFFNRYENVGYYFRHLYQLMKFIKQNEDDKLNQLSGKASEMDKTSIHNQYKQYAQFIQSQMSILELLMLFYNSFAFKKMQELLIHYELLENLTIQNLIKKEHNCIPSLRLKDKAGIVSAILND